MSSNLTDSWSSQNPSAQFSSFFDKHLDAPATSPTRNPSQQLLDAEQGRFVCLNFIALIADSEGLPPKSLKNSLLPIVMRCLKDDAPEIRRMTAEALAGMARVLDDKTVTEDIVSSQGPRIGNHVGLILQGLY